MQQYVILAAAIHTLKLKQSTKDFIIERLRINFDTAITANSIRSLYNMAKFQDERFAVMLLKGGFKWTETFEGTRFWMNVCRQLENQYLNRLNDGSLN